MRIKLKLNTEGYVEGVIFLQNRQITSEMAGSCMWSQVRIGGGKTYKKPNKCNYIRAGIN